MKFKCCENLMYHLVFAQSDVMACCCAKNHDFIKFFRQQEQKTFDFKEYEQKRSYYIEQFKQNIIPSGCIGCPFIVEKDWDEQVRCKNIIVSNRTKCSCNCIYCSLLEGDDSITKKKELNTRETYDIIPILSVLEQNNYIQDGCNVQIAGGEPTEYPKGELDWLLEFSVRKKCTLEVLSSGINYSKKIEKVLAKNSVRLVISPDSGSSDMYNRIKRIKAFDKVWNNIKNYIKKSKSNERAMVVLKYIIIPDVNDSIEEVVRFLEKAKEVECKNVVFSIEFNWLEKKCDITKRLQSLACFLIDNYVKEKQCFEVSFEKQIERWFYNVYKQVREEK